MEAKRLLARPKEERDLRQAIDLPLVRAIQLPVFMQQAAFETETQGALGEFTQGRMKSLGLSPDSPLVVTDEMIALSQLALEQLNDDYDGLLNSRASRFIQSGDLNITYGFDGARQMAFIALRTLAISYDEEGGASFSTYLNNHLYHRMIDHLRTDSHDSRASRANISTIMGIINYIRECGLEITNATIELAIAELQVNISVKTVEELLSNFLTPHSIDGPLSNSRSFGIIDTDSTITLKDTLTPLENVSEEVWHGGIDALVGEFLESSALTDQERTFLRRYSELGYVKGSIAKIAGELGVTPSRISQIKSSVLGKFRQSHSDQGDTEPKIERKTERKISPREAEVLLYLAQGMSMEEIGDKLLISAKTVKNHIAKISEVFNTHSSLATILKAVKLGLELISIPSVNR